MGHTRRTSRECGHPFWNWSFAGESGAFLTDGTAVGQVVAPGTYDFKDFTVGFSAVGEPVGSVTGGQYVASGFSDTSTPYSFVWNGSAVTEWDKTGLNDFNWRLFNNTAGMDFYMSLGTQRRTKMIRPRR